jgi:peptide/nickel transport system substrate-binding protein
MNPLLLRRQKAGFAVVTLLCALCTTAYAGGAPETEHPRSFGSQAISTAEHQSPPFTHAPSLDAAVARGELPPVDQRLPANPEIVQPIDEIGAYGGTWRMGMKSVRDMGFFVRTVAYENLLSWDAQWTNVVPNVAQGWAVDENAQVYTFKLREGMRWSDGHPFTAADILFYWECMNRPDLKPAGPPNWLTVGGAPAKFEQIDDYTVRISFDEPYGLFPQILAKPAAGEMVSLPAHYLSAFLPENDPDINAEAVSRGYDGWQHYFNTARRAWFNPELPTLHAWLFENAYEGGSVNPVALRRNPYYFKVDTEYQQLPYIERLHFTVHENAGAIIEAALTGKIHMQERHIALPELRATYEERGRREGYSTFDITPSLGNLLVVKLNLTHPDPRMRSILSDHRFRAALSIAIDRRRIITDVYAGSGTPSQSAPRPESRFYDDTLATQYTEYDPDQAVTLLEEVGFSQFDPDGYRLAPDGQPFSITIEVADVFNYDWPSAVEYIVRDWADVGIRARIDLVDWNELDDYRNFSRHDALVWTGGGGLDPILEPDSYFPAGGESGFAMRWAWWYLGSDGFPIEEPPAAVKRQMALYDQLEATADAAKQDALMHRILDIARDQFYSIGIVRPNEAYGIVRDDFHNVPEVMPGSWVYPTPAPTEPCQYFIRE